MNKPKKKKKEKKTASSVSPLEENGSYLTDTFKSLVLNKDNQLSYTYIYMFSRFNLSHMVQIVVKLKFFGGVCALVCH